MTVALKKGAKFYTPDYLAIAIRNLEKGGINDRAYTKKAWSVIYEFYSKLKNSQSVFEILERHNMLYDYPPRKNDILASYAEIKDIYEKHRIKSKGVLRFVDFNQGMDARLFTPEKAELLSKIAIRPVRIAFDDIKYTKKYEAAIRMCAKVGIKDFSNYLLYNFKDKPVDLYKRMRINVDLCDTLSEETGQKVSIYSFPMKYHPLRKTNDMDQDYSHNRDYIGVNWNRKFIRAVQAVLNSTKGKIGRGTSFFNEAFGSNEQEFEELLYMPESMIIYRFLFKWLGTDEAHEVAKQIIGSDEVCDYSTSSWRNCFHQCKKELPPDLWEDLKKKIGSNDFVTDNETFTDSLEKRLLWYYTNSRKDVTDETSDICKMKHYYDKNVKDKPSHYEKKC